MKKKIKKKWIILLVVLVVIAVGIGGCMYKLSTIKPMVETTTMQEMELSSYLSTSGTIKKGDTLDFTVSERTNVDKVHVKIGDTVKNGDLLVSFNHDDAQEELKRASISYEKQRLSLIEAERVYFEIKEDIKDTEEKIEFCKEKREQYENSAYPDDVQLYQRYDGLVDSYKSQKEALEKSIPSAEKIKIDQLTFEEIKMNLEKTQDMINNLPKDIYATADGVIEALTVADMRPTDKGQVAVTLKTNTANTIDVEISKYDISKISVGMPCDVTVSGIKYQGEISEIDSFATTPTAVKAKVLVRETDKNFIPGLEADIELLTYTNPNAQVLPIEAVKTDRNGDFCYVTNLLDAEKGTYSLSKQYITVGNTSDFYIEIKDGLTPDTQVVKNPPNNVDMMPFVGIIPDSQPTAE